MTEKKQNQETEKMKKKFDQFEEEIKTLTQDRMNEAPSQDIEPQTKLSQKEVEKSKDIYLKPITTISDPAKFNEKFREDWNYKKEYVQFIAEHRELIGEVIEAWTRPFGGVGASYWKIPTNKPVWGPRYLAEQIRGAKYHRLRMEESRMTGSEGGVTYFGQMIADTTIQRLTAEPVSPRKSVFMGAAA
jgi:hypothetical protein